MIIITYVEEYDRSDSYHSVFDSNHSDFSIKYFDSEDSAATFIAKTQLENEGSQIQHVLINFLKDIQIIAENDLFGRDIGFGGSNMDLHYAEGIDWFIEDCEDGEQGCRTEINVNMASRITELAKSYYVKFEKEKKDREALDFKQKIEKQKQKQKQEQREYKLRVFEELRKELGK
jgi:hypothetical protein